MDNRNSEQYQLEWEVYRDAFKKSGVLEKTKVLDLLGNHDSFNSINTQIQNNYSIFDKNEKTVSDGLEFIPVQLADFPGIGKPFNFIGHVQNKDLVFSQENRKNSN